LFIFSLPGIPGRDLDLYGEGLYNDAAYARQFE
jgi:hypothetical protein